MRTSRNPSDHDHGGPEAFDIYEDNEEDSNQVSKTYSGFVKRKRLFIIVGVLLLVLCVIIAAQSGPIDISFVDVIRSIFTFDMNGVGGVVWNIRMVRIVGALFAGAGLAVAGVVMQCILRNPLASPFTLGISSAAAFGASFAIIFLGAGSSMTSLVSINNPYVTTVCAFLFSLLATGAILLLTKITKVSAETMILAGVAISVMFSAGLSFMQYIATDSQLGNIVAWTFGDLGKATWSWNALILLVLLPVAFYFFYKRWDYNALDAGEDTAKGLGVNTERERIVGMVLTSVLAAFIVSFFGIIAFIGLLGPHIARMIIGSDHRYLIPLSIILGAIILIIADGVGQVILYPAVIPVGIITSMLGGPLFIYLLIRRYRK
ncbi:MAG: iron ABC transporter permease [Candidatus Bathyarchaeota archaeon]|nr:iron ABC transporter permease [Candidatus Bathyarchaeota archaeon]